MAGETLVIGGGIAGLTAAIEIAETGYDVIVVEKNPYLGGRVSQLNKYFPKLYAGFKFQKKLQIDLFFSYFFIIPLLTREGLGVGLYFQRHYNMSKF